MIVVVLTFNVAYVSDLLEYLHISYFSWNWRQLLLTLNIFEFLLYSIINIKFAYNDSLAFFRANCFGFDILNDDFSLNLVLLG